MNSDGQLHLKSPGFYVLAKPLPEEKTLKNFSERIPFEGETPALAFIVVDSTGKAVTYFLKIELDQTYQTTIEQSINYKLLGQCVPFKPYWGASLGFAAPPLPSVASLAFLYDWKR